MVLDVNLTDADKLAYFQKNFFTLDGLWMVAAEEHLGLDKAIEIDLDVWERFFPIIYRRITQYLGIEGRTAEDFVRVLAFRWAAEGWTFTIDEASPERAVVSIHAGGCPYYEGLQRAQRPDKVPRICNDVCDRLYEIAAQTFNPEIKVSRTRRLGNGDETCNFVFEIACPAEE